MKNKNWEGWDLGINGSIRKRHQNDSSLFFLSQLLPNIGSLHQHLSPQSQQSLLQTIPNLIITASVTAAAPFPFSNFVVTSLAYTQNRSFLLPASDPTSIAKRLQRKERRVRSKLKLAMQGSDLKEDRVPQVLQDHPSREESQWCRNRRMSSSARWQGYQDCQGWSLQFLIPASHHTISSIRYSNWKTK